MMRFYRCPGCRLSPCARRPEGGGERPHGGHVGIRVGALEGSGQGLSGCAQVRVVSRPAAEERLSLEAQTSVCLEDEGYQTSSRVPPVFALLHGRGRSSVAGGSVAALGSPRAARGTGDGHVDVEHATDRVREGHVQARCVNSFSVASRAVPGRNPLLSSNAGCAPCFEPGRKPVPDGVVADACGSPHRANQWVRRVNTKVHAARFAAGTPMGAPAAGAGRRGQPQPESHCSQEVWVGKLVLRPCRRQQPAASTGAASRTKLGCLLGWEGVEQDVPLPHSAGLDKSLLHSRLNLSSNLKRASGPSPAWTEAAQTE